ncbi:MAG: amino acid adenylation domain-containing protein, partial [Halanaerobiales bacterium]|nr:amino acid adenylation domain-containing protein [Halanaerobiales bacterium]
MALQNRISKIAQKMPDKIAIKHGNREVPYYELENYSNQIASFFQSQLTENKNVILLLDRSPELIFSMLGILKIGGIFVPLDLKHPENRLNIMMNEVQSNWIVLHSKNLAKVDRIIKDWDRKINVLLWDSEKVVEDEYNNLNIYRLSEDQSQEYEEVEAKNCYIYFTSGSTGTPKGILGRHKSLEHFIAWEIKEFGINQEFNISQLTSPSFDAILRDIFTTLSIGATICIPENEDIILNPQRLIEWIDLNQITLIHMTPALFKSLVSELNDPELFQSLKYILMAGEKLRGNDVKKFIELFSARARSRIQLVNLYGTTETTLIKLFYKIKEEDRFKANISVGHPIDRTQVLVLNNNMLICDPGIVGEVYIRTPFITSGYYKSPDATKEVFLINPFTNNPRDIIYKTGDLGRMLSDGNLEIIGRIDHQVKIRGMRVEPGDIEFKVLAHDAIRDTIIIDREDENGETYLCGYIISDQEISISEMRQFLEKDLPDYMIPTYLVRLDKMPLNPNGKIDRNALPEPDKNIDTGVEYVAPDNEIEEKLVKIWSEVLGRVKIGIYDNFFDLGGHSLKATSVVSKIYQEFEVNIALREMFKEPTIKALGKYIQRAEKSSYAFIPVTHEKDFDGGCYPVSSAQRRLYLLNQLDITSTNYNMPQAMLIEGEIDKEKLHVAFLRLIKRHDSLRTSFELREGEVVQLIHQDVDFYIQSYEIESQADFKKEVQHLVNEFVKPFELSKAPLLRVGLAKFRGTKDKYVLLYDMHHIISDGTSLFILINDFIALYQGKELPDLRIQYKDFTIWQNNLFNSDKINDMEEYWLNHFGIDQDEIPVLNLPTDYPRAAELNFEGNQFDFNIGKELTEKVNKLSKETQTTLYMSLLAAYNLLLSKYSGQEDIIVGSPISGRLNVDLEQIIGMFINTLAMRNRPKGNLSVREFLADVKDNALQAYDNQDYQFEMLVDKLDLQRDMSRNPLFDTMFVLQNFNSSITAEVSSLKVSTIEFENPVSKFDLTLKVTEIPGDIHFRFEYCTKLFKQETIERLSEHFINILNVIVENPDIKLRDINIISNQERDQLLYEFNNSQIETLQISKNKTIHQLFEEQVKKTPENIAVVSRTCGEDKELTYRELNEKANRLARTLRENGVNADSIVGISVNRSFEMMIGILGILKAGGAYLPINPDYPEERVGYMLKDSGTDILLTHEYLINEVPFRGQSIALEDEQIYLKSGSNLESIKNSQGLAYIIYTSGSTGKPKGVMISHKALNNFLCNIYSCFGENVGIKDNCLSLTNISFDVSICELFMPLIFGATLVLYDNEMIPDIHNLVRTILDKEITFAYIPPTILREVYERLSNEKVKLNKMLVGVESIKDYVLEDYMKLNDNMQIINGYGPTEATICTTFYKYGQIAPVGRNVPIGKPLANTQIYILDQYSNPVPMGTVGELCISGDGLAEGYLNREDLTTEKFVPNPFIFGMKMYKTGDMARLLPDGNIEFLGRIDHQVKIRGYRIEPGEIECQLLNYDSIKEAIVVDREDKNGEKYLCAYVVSEKEVTVGDFTPKELREFLLKSLPEYMIPSYFVQLDQMPLTANGKISRKSLPEPEGNIVVGTEYEAPRNETEEKLADVWKKVLGIKKVGINDNFFELGGHSLKAIVLVSKIHKEFNSEVPLSEMFKRPTIKELATYIQKSDKKIFTAIQPLEEKEYYKASSAQKRMYMLQQFDLSSTSYNIPAVFEIEGNLNYERLKNAFKTLIERHETLRTSFETLNDKVIQRVHKKAELKVEILDNIEQSNKIIDELVQKFIKTFDLSKAPLFRIGVIRVAEEKFILMFDMHHIISDGISMGILISEFVDLYEGKKLDELKIQYKDYADWQNKLITSDVMKEQEEYWLNKFSDHQNGGQISVLNLPTDYPRPVIQSHKGDKLNFIVEEKLTKELNRLVKETNSTMYMVLLSGINILLSKYSNQEDIIIGSPIAGRPHADLEKIIGMFINTLAMRNNLAGNKTYKEFLKEVKENALEAYEHQDYQFEELVDKLNLHRDMSRNPLFDVMFVLQNIDKIQIDYNELKTTPYKLESTIAKFDLTLHAIEIDEKINCSFEYCTDLFKSETIERLAKHYLNILQTVVENPEIHIAKIELLSEEEKQHLLYEINDTDADYPELITIQQIFERQVAKTPDKLAVVFEDQQLSYRMLNEKANQLARCLRNNGVKADTIVGIMLNRSLELIIGIMGILKAGGAYLPIDPTYPEDRIEYMVKDSEIDLLLTERGYLSNVDFSGKILDVQDENIFTGESSNLDVINQSHHLAYIIYTSGSTGKPKGVMIEHRNLVRLLFNDQFQFDFNEEDVWTMFHSQCFDFSVWEIFGALLYGGKLVVIPKLSAQNPDDYLEILLKEKVTVVNQTPTAFYNLSNVAMDSNKKDLKVRYIIFGGEALKSVMLKAWKERYPKTRLINMYGITETTVHVTFKEIVEEDIERKLSNVGKPIPTLKVYILDKHKHLLPYGVPGELCVTGAGVARGYLNRPELTEKKFIKNPFKINDFEERLYCSGDYARLLSDGNIEYLGRIDRQVKIRGFRIELGEIENQLLDYNPIKEAIVVDQEDKNGSKYLCAYVVSSNKVTAGELTPKELREFLLKSLPEYMIPSYFVQLDEIPINANGKVDRRALPESEGKIVVGTEYEAPRNEIEEKLTEVWKEVLGEVVVKDKIGINANFFELGGHSLKAIILLAKMHKALNVEVPFNQVFKTPTIKELAQYIKKAEENIYSSIQPVEESEYYPVSSSQKRIHILWQIDGNSLAYNMPSAMILEGELDNIRFEKTIEKLVQRHDALRTSFRMINGEVMQEIHKEVDIDISYQKVNESELKEAATNFIRPFDLSKAPLLRVVLMKFGFNKHLLLFDMHHIVSDGVSMTILTRDFNSLYEGTELPELKIQYKDYASWHNSLMESELMKEMSEYWIRKLDNFTYTELPTTNISSNKQLDGRTKQTVLNEILTEQINEFCINHKISKFIFMLSTFEIVIMKTINQNDITIGIPVAGRRHEDLQNIIGVFLNVLVTRSKIENNATFKDY